MAGALISITVDNERVNAALTRLVKACVRLRPAMLEIGAELEESTKRRFATQAAPDGTAWAPLRPWYLASERKRKSRGPNSVLVLRGHLLDTIHHEAHDDHVVVGTDREYGAAMQFGMKKGYAGTSRRGRPIPWGDIPPRPYLGVSAEDERTLLRILSDHLEAALRG